MLQIFENFYEDPDAVREFALALPYDVVGNYPGVRTPCMNQEFCDYIQGYLEEKLHTKITYFPRDLYNTSFQYTTKDAKTWIHHDSTKVAGVLYLTPNAPIESGTAIYRHKNTGIYRHEEGQIDYNEDPLVEEDWEKIIEVGNVYNRLVIYDGMYYHRSVLPGFGTDLHTGRLFQTFFFDI